MRGEPNQRPNAASSAAPRFWSRNTSTGCSANTRPIQAKVASSSGLERSMPNASVPSSSPSGRSWGELVMGGPPTLSPERWDWGTGTIIGLRAVRGENRKRWVSVRPVRPSPRFRCTVVVPTARDMCQDCRYPIAERQCGELFVPTSEECICADHEAAGSQFSQSCEDGIDVSVVAGMEQMQLQPKEPCGSLQVSR